MTFDTVEDFGNILDKINEQFGCDEDDEPIFGLVYNGKVKYVKLKCCYQDCPFEHWFTCKSNNGDKVKEIKFCR